MMEYFYGTNEIKKADLPHDTGTPGILNVIFGAFAFNQLNSEANAFALLPKYPWQHSGWRAITADAGSTAGGGVAETATIPDTARPTFQEITVTTKQVAHTFDVSYIQEGKVHKGDDAIGDMEFLRGYFAQLHAKRMNEMILVDADTLAGNNFESIDRVTFSAAAQAALSYTAADDDIYGINRGTYAWADSVVSHNSGTDRYLTDDHIRDSLATIAANGGRTNIILTGEDTKWRIIGLYDTQVRYQGVLSKDQMVSVGVNGVNTEEGIGVGVRVSHVYGIPMFSSHGVKKDTISRIYLLDTTEQEGSGVPRLGIALMYPTLYFETGMSAANPNPFVVDSFLTRGMYYTAGELVCTFFKAQGSIRDLK